MRISVDGQARLSREKAAAIEKINSAADTVRRNFITPIAGQDMVYLRKESEARRYLVENPATLQDFPLLAAEVGVTAPAAVDLAQLWISMSDAWISAAAALEHARMTGIEAVKAATTLHAILTATQGAVDEIIAVGVQP